MTDIAPATTEQPAADPVSTELATIRSEMGNQLGPYWKGPKIGGETLLARRFQELVAAGAGAKPPAPISDSERRQAEIRAEMREGGRYWKSPEMQKEFRDLLERPVKAPQPAAAPVSAEVVAAWQSPAGQEIAAEMMARGGWEHNRLMANKAANDILAEMPEDTRSDFELGWSVLPPDASIAVMAELTNPHGTIKQRVERIIDRCASDDSARKLAHFINSMTDAEWRVVERRFSHR